MVHYTSEMLEQSPWWEESRPSDNPLYADGVSYQAYYSEVGKAHHMGKDLTEVRSLQRKLVPDIVGLGQYEQTSLRGIAIKARADGKHRFQNLYRKSLLISFPTGTFTLQDTPSFARRDNVATHRQPNVAERGTSGTALGNQVEHRVMPY